MNERVYRLLSRTGAPALVIADADRSAPPARKRSAVMPALLLLASLAVHATVLAVIDSAPPAFPRVGVPAITVDMVLGDNIAAGLANMPRENVTEVKPNEAKLAEIPAERAPLVRPPVTDAVDAVEARAHTAAAVETLETPPPVADAVRVLPRVAATSELTEVTVPGAPPEPLRRMEQELPVEKVEELRQRARPEPVPPSVAGGSGRGGALAGDIQYAGRFAAHLARHKRFPPDGRRRGERGSAAVDVSIDGTGRVTEVRVVRSSGFASLDRAAEAMVWRASPFPAPPGQRPMQLSVPITYSID